MTENRTNLSKRCHICTGCGRCPWKEPDYTVVTAPSKEKPAYEPMRVSREACIIAVDIGTTTIVMQLRRAVDGEVLDTFSAINPQRKYGADVLSRIQAAEAPEQKKDMALLVREVLEQGILQFRKWEVRWQATRMVIAANTTMVHLLMEYEVSGLGKAPFYPEHLEEIHTQIAGVPTVILPGLSAFVGGDIIAGLFALAFDRSKEISLFVDLGTNGEMALGNRQRILSTATAAGPAFEGGAAVGIWGADMVAMTAALLQQGVLNETGLLADPYFDQGVRIGDILFTQKDIRSLQMAKAAICAGVRILCNKYSLDSMSQIKKVYLAGGFGYFLDPDAAVAIGLLPRELKGNIVAVGNTALEGAFCYGRTWDETGENISGKRMRTLLEHTTEFNLAMEEDFNDLYIASMGLE